MTYHYSNGDDQEFSNYALWRSLGQYGDENGGGGINTQPDKKKGFKRAFKRGFFYLLVVLGIILAIVLAFTAFKTKASTIMIYQYNPSNTSSNWYPSGSSWTFSPVTSGAPSSMDFKVDMSPYLNSNIVFYIKDGSGNLMAQSNPTNIGNGGNPIYGYVVTAFFSNGTQTLQAGNTYTITVSGFPQGQAGICQDASDSSKLWINLYAYAPDISITTGGSYSLIARNFNINYSLTLPSSGSYKTRLLFDNTTNKYTSYVDGVPMSYPAGSVTSTFYLTNLQNGDYSNFRAYLMDYSGAILATATSSLTLHVTSTIPILPIEGETGNNFTSSTAWYSANLPSVFSDNGIATPTVFYSAPAGVIDTVLNYIYDIAGGFLNFFDFSKATNVGITIHNGFLAVAGFINAFDTMTGYPFGVTIYAFLALEVAFVFIKMIRLLLFR
jgi:hypothetical protein